MTSCPVVALGRRGSLPRRGDAPGGGLTTQYTTTDDFREAVRTAMAARDMTVRDLAAAVQGHHPNLVNWLNRKADIRLATMLAVARALGIRVRLELVQFGE